MNPVREKDLQLSGSHTTSEIPTGTEATISIVEDSIVIVQYVSKRLIKF